MEEKLNKLFNNLDEDVRGYICSLIIDNMNEDISYIQELIEPFLTSSDILNDNLTIEKIYDFQENYEKQNYNDDKLRKLAAPISFKRIANNQIGANEDVLIESLWGLNDIRKTYNQPMLKNEGKSSRTKRRELREERKLIAKYEEIANKEGEQDEGEMVSEMKISNNDDGDRVGEQALNLENFDVHIGSEHILSGASLTLAYGRRYGLIGKNGVGKTTLLRRIAAHEIPGMNTNHRILHVKQEIGTSESTVIETILNSDVERKRLLDRLNEINSKETENEEEFMKNQNELSEIFERLEIIGSDNAELRARSICTGLQFTDEMQDSPISSLSGGWRMRVALACGLYLEPDILMLDEPTNHLDIEAVVWLQNRLLSYPHILLIVSHDREFLNEVCTDIIYFHNKLLKKYRGNFDTFKKTREEDLINQQKVYEAQMTKKSQMEEFIRKFRYNAKRASLVQSRIKALEKLEAEIIIPEREEPPFRFSFPLPQPINRPILQMNNVSFAYTTLHGNEKDYFEEEKKIEEAYFKHEDIINIENKDKDDDKKKNKKYNTSNIIRNNNDDIIFTSPILFSECNFEVDMDSRIALCGRNGAGKTTFLKVLLSQLEPIEGEIRRNPKLKLASFTQHHADHLDLNLSPLRNLIKKFPDTPELEARSFLGRFNISGDLALKPCKWLSGGQKSRVAFCLMAFSRPQVCLMDEATNNLDVDTIDALIEAIQAFRGGILIVSHDQYFISRIANEIWSIGDGHVTRFNGTFDEYKKYALTKIDGINKERIKKQKLLNKSKKIK